MGNLIWPELTPLERIERLNFMIDRDLEKFVNKHNVCDIFEDLREFRFICLSLALMKCSMTVYASCLEDLDEDTKSRFHEGWENQQIVLRGKLPLPLSKEIIDFATRYGFIVVRLYVQIWDELKNIAAEEREFRFNVLKQYVRGYGDLEEQNCLNFRETFCTLMQKFCNEFRD